MVCIVQAFGQDLIDNPVFTWDVVNSRTATGTERSHTPIGCYWLWLLELGSPMGKASDVGRSQRSGDLSCHD